ncbi:hypothetical protein HMPREF3127_17495 [Sphingobacterium sp. HMSC13C05]|nr:hypothetical protein HMPREF3127_17495 [Sphingobacterium sp. HMSC13C05]
MVAENWLIIMLFFSPLYSPFFRVWFVTSSECAYIFPTDYLHIAYIISREGVGKQWRRSGRPPNKGRGRYEGFMKKDELVAISSFNCQFFCFF